MIGVKEGKPISSPAKSREVRVAPMSEGKEEKMTNVSQVSEAWTEQARLSQQYTCTNGMTICTQPAGIATDYLLTVIGVACGAVLLSMSPPAPTGYESGKTGTAVWNIGFLFSSALSGLIGGAVHHFCLKKTDEIGRGVLRPGVVDGAVVTSWSVVMGLGSLPNFFLYCIGLWLVAEGGLGVALTCGGGVAYFIAACIVAKTRRIIVHVAFSVPTILFFGVTNLIRVNDNASVRWNLGATIGLFAAGAVVALKPSISKRHFNHNSLMHCVMFVVCLCIFMSAYEELV